MSFLKKELPKRGKIYKKEVLDESTNKVVEFYREAPFPNYKSDDNKSTILEKGDKSYLAREFKKFIGYKKNILEVGCGTGQLSIYFSIGTNNNVVGLDPTIYSLDLAANFAEKNEINNVEFINVDIFDDVLKDEGYVLIGLYNKIGRIRTLVRKYIYKIFGLKILSLLDPTLKNLKISEDEKKSWVRDQYLHPIESLHTLDEVIKWFDENNIEFINSIPSSDFDDEYSSNLFEKKSKGSLYSRLINQFIMIFNRLGSDGGLFVVIGKKK